MKKKSMVIEATKKNNRVNKIMTLVMVAVEVVLDISLGFFLKEFIDSAEQKNLQKISFIIKLFLIYLLVLTAALTIRSFFQQRYMFKAISQYKKMFFKKIINKTISFKKKNDTGGILSSFTNDMIIIETKYLFGEIRMFRQIIQFTLALIAMFYMNYMISIIVIVSTILPIIVTKYLGSRIVSQEKKVSDANMKFLAFVKNILDGFSIIKCFRAENEISSIYAEKCEYTENTKKKRKTLTDVLNGTVLVSSYLVYLLVFGFGSYLTYKGVVTVGVLVGMVQLLTSVIYPAQRLGEIVADRKSASALVDKLDSLVEEEEKDSRSVTLSDLKDCIEFDSVYLCPDGKKNILKDINLKFEKGKSYIIVGESGSGKTSLINLLMGYFDIYNGSVNIDGNELSDITLESLYNMISIVEQNVFVFDDTIKNNITMYKNFSDEEYMNAVSIAGLDKLISKSGNDYLCGENGKNLSGGEKQRISIARSVLKKSSVLIMDEATSALDKMNTISIENEIMSIENITRIIITHHEINDMFRKSDHIIVMDDGMVKENGTYDELVSAKGAFYELLKRKTKVST